MDARKWRDGGIGTYIRNLVACCLAKPEGHRFVVFLLPEDLGKAARPSAPAEEIRVTAGKYSIAEHWQMARAARRAQIDLFHAPHYTLPLSLRCPSVVTIHDLIHVRFARFHPPGAGLYARAIAGAAARKARLILVDSTHVRAEVVEILGAPESRVRVIPLGVSRTIARRPAGDVDAFVRARGLPRDYVLYVGSRKRHKNLQLLIEALGRMRSENRPPLVLSGPPWGGGEPLSRAAAEAGVMDRISFAGEMERDEDLALLYTGAALYAQPSLEEGFGLPPLEAMACGTPVLSSSSGALSETLGDAAALMAPNDADAWADAIGSLLSDGARRAEMIRRGLARARQFTWERTAAMTIEAYREAAGRD